jgi:hypothetical protein
MFDLYLNAAERADGSILVQCDHNTALVSPQTMQGWLAHFHALLKAVAQNPEVSVAELPLTEFEIAPAAEPTVTSP